MRTSLRSEFLWISGSTVFFAACQVRVQPGNASLFAPCLKDTSLHTLRLWELASWQLPAPAGLSIVSDGCLGVAYIRTAQVNRFVHWGFSSDSSGAWFWHTLFVYKPPSPTTTVVLCIHSQVPASEDPTLEATIKGWPSRRITRRHWLPPRTQTWSYFRTTPSHFA